LHKERSLGSQLLCSPKEYFRRRLSNGGCLLLITAGLENIYWGPKYSIITKRFLRTYFSEGEKQYGSAQWCQPVEIRPV